jgi:hypothetical protein
LVPRVRSTTVIDHELPSSLALHATSGFNVARIQLRGGEERSRRRERDRRRRNILVAGCIGGSLSSGCRGQGQGGASDKAEEEPQGCEGGQGGEEDEVEVGLSALQEYVWILFHGECVGLGRRERNTWYVLERGEGEGAVHREERGVLANEETLLH